MCTLYHIHCTLYTIQCTVYSVQCIVYTVQCTVYSVQCIVYIVKAVSSYGAGYGFDIVHYTTYGSGDNMLHTTYDMAYVHCTVYSV